MTGAVCAVVGSAGLHVTLTPDSVSGSGTGTVTTTEGITAGVIGGIAPYSYAWTLDGDAGIFALNVATANTSFRRNDCLDGEIYDAQATCTVSDSGGLSSSATGSVHIVGAA